MNKEILEKRATAIRTIREFFWSDDFLEVDAPAIVRLPGQEPNLAPMQIPVHDETKQAHQLYLHTSPEYVMKKCLGAGMEKIFFFGKTYRDEESFGGLHHPEFTMIEWYRNGSDMFALIDDCKHMISSLCRKLAVDEPKNVEVVSMKELWQQTLGVNLDEHLTKDAMMELCQKMDQSPSEDESYEELFYRIFLNHIEPALKERGAVFVYNYPAQMAALARVSAEDNRYAERFEFYIDGVEIANAFSELCDPDEQRRRFEEEIKERERRGMKTYPVDEELLTALENIDSAAGIALGFDRLLMTLLGCKRLEDVLVLPLN